ncbi:hypothetical protein HYDPIDRAFT_111188 [Hydnomerulius pinastri MD-312]|uniref:Uncharacterized protein n=1 Tax=Hydnomerulius pinastri MD-312 TaxID=994086 RepID=A0A0C9WB24_9AGAM|nr:hypothetical protein HYDPIDRAFT_119525 [Hydnomerulius pinastri MD-312]KIJ65248.1 hypothetical protein HYDPIDRAFT_111188 [Hydnomerulius pinastri MD-312]
MMSDFMPMDGKRYPEGNNQNHKHQRSEAPEIVRLYRGCPGCYQKQTGHVDEHKAFETVIENSLRKQQSAGMLGTQIG